MIKRLYLENFALTDRLEINFGPGLNVLTGETGAGKSIIIGALARLLGDRAEKDDIRSGAAAAVIEGEFDIEKNRDLKTGLDELGLEHDGESITLRREIPRNKSSRTFINNQLVTLAQLRPLADRLAELYGQHSHQLLLDENNHLIFLDLYAGLSSEVSALNRLFHRWESDRKQLKRLIARREAEKNERELYRFQRDEIETAQIRIGEEDKLLTEKKILDSSQELAEKSDQILAGLDREDHAALNVLSSVQKEMGRMSDLDARLEKAEKLLEQAVINLEELRSEIEAYQSSIPDDPGRQEAINIRLDEIYRLKKKYGGSEETILATLEKIGARLNENIDIDERIRKLESTVSKLKQEYGEKAVELSRKRERAAVKLNGRVEKELARLAIEGAAFKFEFQTEPDPDGFERGDRKVAPGPDGLETGRMLFSANPGEPLKPLARIASGGEISRIMLALKASGRNRAGTGGLLVFDEIDAGIGGRTALAVGQKLAGLATGFQLLVVTHLHQIASVASHHYAVEKRTASQSKRNVVTVKELNKAERSGEIKRMLALPE